MDIKPEGQLQLDGADLIYLGSLSAEVGGLGPMEKTPATSPHFRHPIKDLVSIRMHRENHLSSMPPIEAITMSSTFQKRWQKTPNYERGELRCWPKRTS